MPFNDCRPPDPVYRYGVGSFFVAQLACDLHNAIEADRGALPTAPVLVPVFLQREEKPE